LSNKNWKNFCIVGSGNHAITKVIPALIAENKDIKGIVSSKKNILSEFKKFNNIKDALINVPKDTVFVIASPPDMHFKQAREIIKYGRDIIIEKPSFIYVKEVEEICSLANYSKNIILEGYMHRYTKLYTEFMRYWVKEKHKIIALKFSFYVPEIPKGSFRDKKDIISSCLYDIGCYGLSLLNDMGLDLKAIKIDNFNMHESRISSVQLKGIVDNISVEIKFGNNKSYENFVEVKTNNNNITKFYPFFYGRKAVKFIEHCKNNHMQLEQFNDCNAFQVMFNENRYNLILNQKFSLNKILVITEKLEKLAKELEKKIYDYSY
jgi:predicted dehydrogenase